MRRIAGVGPYFAGTALPPLLGLAQTALLTRMLDPADYGRIQLLTPISGVLGAIGGVGAANFLLREYSALGEESRALALFAAGAGLAVAAAVALPMLWFFPSAVGLESRDVVVALCLVLASVSAQYAQIVKAHCRALELHVRYNVLAVAERLAGVAAVVAIVACFPRNAVGGFLAGTAVGSLGAAVTLRPRATEQTAGWIWPSSADLRTLLRYGVPQSLVLVCGDLFSSLARFLLLWGGMATAIVAKYAVNSALVLLAMQVVSEPLVMYAQPKAFRIFETAGAVAAIAYLRRYMWIASGLAALVLSLGMLLHRPIVTLVAGAGYVLDGVTFSMLLGASALLMFYRFSATRLFFVRRTDLMLLNFVYGMIANAGCASFAVPRWGMRGAAFANLVGAGVTLVGVEVAGRRAMRALAREGSSD